MSVIDRLRDPAAWAAFVEYKTRNLPLRELEELRRYVENRQYEPVADAILRGEGLSPPVQKQISKLSSGKKRTVYIHPKRESLALKLLTYLLIRKYDAMFAPNLYSFRASRTVRQAWDRLIHAPLSGQYVYKVDVSDYFNSIDVELLLPMLREALADDPRAYDFLAGMLRDDRAVCAGEIAHVQKGIMAGCPVSAFLANVFLSGLDWTFYRRGMFYARFSDDIIVFAPTEADREEAAALIAGELARLGLKVNPRKELRASPHEGWDFLGFGYRDGRVDISPASARKLKGKMRRKADALLRWKRRKQLDNRHAARAFVKAFNRKLYENPHRGEITWARWFFPIINTPDTLRALDGYMQDCIRYIATEKRTKRRYDFRYQDMKALGYRSLVHEYYSTRKPKGEPSHEED